MVALYLPKKTKVLVLDPAVRDSFLLQGDQIQKGIKGFGFVVVSMQVDFKRSARLDDQLLVSCSISDVRASSAIFHQDITDSDGNVYVRATTKIASVDLNRKRPTGIPPEIKEVFLSECD